MSKEKRDGIVGKYPNSNRDDEPIGRGSDSPIVIPDITGTKPHGKERKNGDAQ